MNDKNKKKKMIG